MNKDLRVYSDDDLDELAERLISTVSRKAVQREIADIIDAEFDRMADDAGYHLATIVNDRCEKFFEKLLEGDENAAQQLFGGDSDRYRRGGWKNGEPWCHLIHGKLFETSGIAMRRRIVEANADVIRSERIADLESIVDGLTRESREKDRRIADLESRL